MLNYNDKNLLNLNFKRRRSLKYNLKLIAKTKATSHLINFEKIDRGHYLVEEQKPVKGIYFILKGKVKIFNTASKQKIQTLRLVSKGDLVGLSSLNESYYWSSAVVVENVEAYFINLKSLKSILKSSNKLGILFIGALAMRLRHYEIRQKHLSLLPAPERVIDALMLTAYKFGKTTIRGLEISICNSRKDLASFASTSTEQTIRTLSHLNSEEFISIVGKSIIILDKNELVNRLKKYSCKDKVQEELNFCYPNLFY